ncbi:MAG: YeeE/YedE family protein [Deltaproteobacteria bacterium]|jgi:uncharacterized membrane protein YedE/YeeE|nr:YeeE/YedE family protein [Deltaproteobacteria bacterium]MBW2498351.1 YeeE/YedE family protein [Deltaproteobacteria bacterium]
MVATRREGIALLSGTLFGAGLALSQMTNPAKVLAFLDIGGSWDPSLAFVMGTALLIAATGNVLHRRRGAAGATGASPSTASPNPPAMATTSTSGGRVDARLIVGSALFGVGWGMAGFCPGPALASLVTGSSSAVLFVVSMLAGMGLYRVLASSALLREPPPPAP